ncbi:hypothetical protein Q7A53_05950 [Halobacillus rhizosphaerae]|uniref:hypothetical protein n=1 Tax=Halobacillus rhizosphaerae TaxID=3064889 RepID=UPI00398B9916
MLSKGKVFINNEMLHKLFNLPEDVEIVSVHQAQDGFEFVIMSKESVEGLTTETNVVENLRRVRVPMKVDISEMVSDLPVTVYNHTTVEHDQKLHKSIAKEVAKEILYNLEREQRLKKAFNHK